MNETYLPELFSCTIYFLTVWILQKLRNLLEVFLLFFKIFSTKDHILYIRSARLLLCLATSTPP